MKSPHVYDKAKYHHGSIAEHGLPDEHAYHHTVCILRWLIENRLMSEFFEDEQKEQIARFRKGEISAIQVYEWWDCCLVDDMLSDEGNAFAMHYFDFQQGRYIHDYISTLKGPLPTEFHIQYTEQNYQKIKSVIDREYQHWKQPKRRWWPFGKKK